MTAATAETAMVTAVTVIATGVTATGTETGGTVTAMVVTAMATDGTVGTAMETEEIATEVGIVMVRDSRRPRYPSSSFLKNDDKTLRKV